MKQPDAAASVYRMGMTFQPHLWLTKWRLAARSDQTRLRAVQRLRQTGNPAVLDLLATALRDKSVPVRVAAAAAVGELKSRQGVPVLLAAINDAAPEVQGAILQALKRIGHSEAKEPLVEVLLKGELTAQGVAAHALNALGWEPRTPEEELHYYVAIGELERAAALGPAADPLLARLLRSGSYPQRVAAANVLGGRSSEAALRGLVAALKDGEALVRTAAAEALAQQQNPEAIDGLLTSLRDRTPQVRAAAAEALGQLGGDRVSEALLQALSDSSWEVRAAVLEALGRLRDPKSLTAVAARLGDPDPEVRQAAADAVAALGDERGMEALLPHLVDLHAGVRQAILRALNQLSPQWERSAAAQQMIPQLQTATRHDDSGVQSAAVSLLKQITGLTATEFSQTTQSLAQRRALAAEMLSALLQDGDPVVRLAAVEALARARLAAGVGALQQALGDADAWVQLAAGEALAAFEQRGAEEWS